MDDFVNIFSRGWGVFGDNIHSGGRTNDDGLHPHTCVDARGSWLSNAVLIVQSRLIRGGETATISLQGRPRPRPPQHHQPKGGGGRVV